MELSEMLEGADSLLGSTYRVWPIGIPRLPGERFGLKNPCADDLYKNVLKSTTDPVMLHKAHLGLGEFYLFLTTKIHTPPASEINAYTHLHQAYLLRPDDDETRYMFSYACRLMGRDAEAPVRALQESQGWKGTLEKCLFSLNCFLLGESTEKQRGSQEMKALYEKIDTIFWKKYSKSSAVSREI
jgi:hypothetical protein